MSITLPPLAWPYTGLAPNIKEMIRARDLEVARLVLECAALKFNQPHQEYFGQEIQDAIRALEVRHHE